MIMIGGLFLWTACSPWLPGAAPTDRQRSGTLTDDSSATGHGLHSILAPGRTATNEMQVIDLMFDVVQATLPIDGVRHSLKVWNHVDELRVDSAIAARLARNGLRMGAATRAAWPALRAVFDAADADVRRDQLFAQRGLPLTIHLGSIEEAESIFSYGRDERLVGKTFAAGDKLVNIDYAFHPELGRCIDVRVGFEVSHDRGMLTWERQGGVLKQVPAYDRHVFADLTPVLTLNPDEFLVIGLGDQAENEYLLGPRFLTRKKSGRRFETLLCLTPRPYRVGDPNS